MLLGFWFRNFFKALKNQFYKESLNFVAGGRRMSERDMTRIGAEAKPIVPGPQLLNSKSVPTLHHIGN